MQHHSSQSGQRWTNSVPTINRVGPGTCHVWGVCGLAGKPSNENAGEDPYSRGVRETAMGLQEIVEEMSQDP